MRPCAGALSPAGIDRPPPSRIPFTIGCAAQSRGMDTSVRQRIEARRRHFSTAEAPFRWSSALWEITVPRTDICMHAARRPISRNEYMNAPAH